MASLIKVGKTLHINKNLIGMIQYRGLPLEKPCIMIWFVGDHNEFGFERWAEIFVDSVEDFDRVIKELSD